MSNKDLIELANLVANAQRASAKAEVAAAAALTRAQEMVHLFAQVNQKVGITIDRADAAQTSAVSAQHLLTTIQALVASIGNPDVAVALKRDLGSSAYRNVGDQPNTVAAGDDSRFTDARVPTAHASTHGDGGADEITPAAIGAEVAGAAEAATRKAPLPVATSRAFTNADHGRVLQCATGVNMTLNTGLTPGFGCVVKQSGTSQVEIIDGAGVTVENINNQFKTLAQTAVITVFNSGAETYTVSGETAA